MARRFRFRLERVLRVSELREAAGRERLLAALEARRREEVRLEGVSRRLSDWRDRFGAAWCLAPAAGEVAARVGGLLRLAGERDGQSRRVAAARGEEAARRAELIRLWQRREVLARLRARRAGQHRVEGLREEQRILDDVGGNRRGLKPAGVVNDSD